jgi:hypothetical protein
MFSWILIHLFHLKNHKLLSSKSSRIVFIIVIIIITIILQVCQSSFATDLMMERVGGFIALLVLVALFMVIPTFSVNIIIPPSSA